MDEPSFIDAFKKYYPRICYVGMCLTKDRYKAEDIAQEAFIKAWELKVPVDKLKAFLFIHVRNRSLNQIRDWKNKGINEIKFSYLQPSSEDSVLGIMIKAELLGMIHEEIDHMPSAAQRIFKLAYFEELKNAEIALLLGLGIQTVKTQKVRMLNRLRHKIDIH